MRGPADTHLHSRHHGTAAPHKATDSKSEPPSQHTPVMWALLPRPQMLIGVTSAADQTYEPSDDDLLPPSLASNTPNSYSNASGAITRSMLNASGVGVITAAAAAMPT